MKVLVLGSGAGGGCPQWNCNCAMCAATRELNSYLKIELELGGGGGQTTSF